MGKGANQVLPFPKRGAENDLALLKGGGAKSFDIVIPQGT